MESLRVRQLRLSAPASDLLGAGQARLAEAFRLAELPGDGLPGRLLIRRLPVGPFSGEVRPARLARRLTRLLRELASDAISFTAPQASEAPAVWVAHPGAPFIELVRASCRSGRFDVSAWFWPGLVPGLGAGTRRSEARQLALAGLLDLPEAFILFSDLLAQLALEGIAEPLLDGWSATHDAALVHAVARAVSAPAVVGSAPSPASAVSLERWLPDARLRQLGRRFVAAWGPEHPRSLAFAHVLQVAAQPTRVVDARLGQRARVIATALAASSIAFEPEPPSAESARARMPAADVVEPVRAEAARSTPEARARDAAPESSVERKRADASGVATALPAAAPALDATSPSAADGREPAQLGADPAPLPLRTQLGGLFFLLNVLSRLQLARFASEHPELAVLDFGIRLLMAVCDRLDAPPDDPVRAALAARLLPAKTEEGAVLEAAPVDAALSDAALSDAALSDAALSNAALSDELELELDAWQRAIVRWLGRYTTLDLAAVVRRPAGVLWTRTHIDVVFDIDHAEAEVRRAALDVDPGYLPWLGRVVKFHYVRSPAFAVLQTMPPPGGPRTDR